MSKSTVDTEGFQTVSKRFSRNKRTKIPVKGFKLEDSDIALNIPVARKNILLAVEELEYSEYFKSVSKAVSNDTGSKQLVELVCFGLGHIGECQISRYQLALLLCLRSSFSVKKVLVHDPIFYKDEVTILTDLGLEVIVQNHEGKYDLSKDGLTLVYLPHCPKQLTNNFLWSNWSPNLSNCILICNSFKALYENQPQRILSETIPYVNNIFPLVKEIDLDNTFKYSDIFNDTSIHTFPSDKLESLPSNFWDKSLTPVYKDTEEFITCEMIAKLKL